MSETFCVRNKCFSRLRGMDTKQMFCVPLVCPPKKHHEQQCVGNNVSSFATTFTFYVVCDVLLWLYINFNEFSDYIVLALTSSCAFSVMLNSNEFSQISRRSLNKLFPFNQHPKKPTPKLKKGHRRKRNQSQYLNHHPKLNLLLRQNYVKRIEGNENGLQRYP